MATSQTPLAFAEENIARLTSELAGWQAVKTALTPVKPDPVVVVPPVIVPPSQPTPVAGHPRTQVGTLGTDKIYDSALGLMWVFSGSPDRFMFIGYNKEYTPLPGVKKPTGISTTNYGNDAPAGSKKPEGYFIRYFTDGRGYYQQQINNEPDEAPPNSTTQTKPNDTKPKPPQDTPVTNALTQIDQSEATNIIYLEDNGDGKTN